MNIKKRRFRCRVFRCFQTWYAVRSRDSGWSLHLLLATDRVLEFSVSGIPAQSMRVVLKRDTKPAYLDAAVYFYYSGECWDSMAWYDAKPLRQHGGVVCQLCDEESPSAVFASREALWTEHVFTPLLDWLDKMLATERAIRFCRREGVTWVEWRKAPTQTTGLVEQGATVHSIRSATKRRDS